jgi:hypothetical protein
MYTIVKKKKHKRPSFVCLLKDEKRDTVLTKHWFFEDQLEKFLRTANLTFF